MVRRSLPLLALACASLVLTGCPNAASTGLPTAYSSNRQAVPAGDESAVTGGKAAAAPMAPGASMDAAAGSSAVPPSQEQSVLKAGAVDDNADFAGYLKYRDGYKGKVGRAYDVSDRAVLKVLDADGKSVSNAEISVQADGAATDASALMTGKTYADGRVLFHPKATGASQATAFTVTAKKLDSTVSKTFKLGDEGPWELKLDAAFAKPSPKLDVLFMLDATGSMGGEIRKLQSTIQTISDRVKALDGQPSVRFGLVSYRDQGDEYVTRKTDFTDDLASFQSALNKVEAGGGGDIPEDLEAALTEGVNNLSWAEGDTIRLVFVVADAAPHTDYPQSVPYTTSLQKAVAKGIKLYMVGASGLTAEGEYAFRQIAQGTMAKYLFVTRGGDAQSGGGETSHTVDQYAEGRLDDIVVDIVKTEVNALGK